MNHYKNYSVEDFVQDLRFRSWVKNPSWKEDSAWQEWIRENRDKREIIEEARAIILSIHPVNAESISDKEIQNEIDHILTRINEDENKDKERIARKVISFSSWVKIAASVSILLVTGWYGIEYSFVKKTGAVHKPVPLADNYVIERVNRSVDTLLISLPDNSSVLLAQNSLIRYPRQFADDSRKVFLKGTAFFEVTKDPHKPFYVDAGKIVAKVVGTSFEISTDPLNEQVRVIVKSGAVSIYSNSEQYWKNPDRQPNVTLTKHEQVVFKDDVSEIQHTRLDSFLIEDLKVPDTYLKFKGTPVEEVFRSLSKVYGVTINIEDANVNGCSLTASFTDEPFALKLDLICRSTGLKYEMVNDHVTIRGDGCEN